jgi:hypothetical protein
VKEDNLKTHSRFGAMKHLVMQYEKERIKQIGDADASIQQLHLEN